MILLLPTEILKQGKMVFEKGASSLKSVKVIETGKVAGTNNLATERKFSVLVVDDDAIIRKIHSKLLSKFPVEVQVAVNGKEAVDLYRSGAFFDLVLMDMEMPIMNGFEVCFTKKKLKFLIRIYEIDVDTPNASSSF